MGNCINDCVERCISCRCNYNSTNKSEGEKAIFNTVSGGTVKDYEGTISYEDATTTPIELAFDQKKYWAIKLDDVDKVQAAGPVLTVLHKKKH